MLKFIVFTCVIVTYSNLCGVKADSCDAKKQIVCYYGSWAVYRPAQGQFTTENINVTLCTKVIYTFVGLSLYHDIVSLDTNTDITLGGFKNVTSLKEQNPCLKVYLALGGWNEGSMRYSVMASTPAGRDNFAEKALNFVSYYGFDGFDLDWEYPTSRGGLDIDKDNFADLLNKIKTRFQPWGFELSIAVTMAKSVMEKAYDVKEIDKYADYVHLMAYDYVSSDSNVTGLIAPLSVVNDSVQFWLTGGLSSSKLVLGIASYARYFILQNQSDHGLGAPVEDKKFGGDYTKEDGFLSYYEMEMLINGYGEYECTSVTEDTNVYTYCEDAWMTHEDVNSTTNKVTYASDNQLGGIMLWSLDTDDFMGYGGHKYPLLNAIYDAVNKN